MKLLTVLENQINKSIECGIKPNVATCNKKTYKKLAWELYKLSNVEYHSFPPKNISDFVPPKLLWIINSLGDEVAIQIDNRVKNNEFLVVKRSINAK